MRWRIVDPNNQPEQVERAKIIARIDSWWRQFEKDCNEISDSFSRGAPGKFSTSGALADWMHQNLNPIDANLMWEFGPAIREKGHRLVITPESSRHLRPLVTTILDRAPKFPGWEFYPYRLPEDHEMAHLTVRSRVGFDSRDFEVRIARGQDNRVDLSFFSPRITSPDDQAASHAAFVVTETLLGEEYLDKWVGGIEVGPARTASRLASIFGGGKKETKHLISLDRMKDTFEAVVQSIRDQLPHEPHFVWGEKAEWTLWKLEPVEADEYPDQADLFVGKSLNPTWWTAAHSGAVFCSERFSRCGETFCYVKLDGSESLDAEKFADKSEIEDALDAVLKPDCLGCQIGGGTGLRYSYIDLALCDLNRGIEGVRKRLQAGNVPKRSWILFYDWDLEAEWVGIYDDSPPPPR